MKTSDAKTRPVVTSTPVGGAEPAGERRAPETPARSLQAPDTVRAALPEPVDLNRTRRDVHGQLQVRGSTPRAKQGTRSKKLRFEQIDALSRLEHASFGPLAERLLAVLAEVRAAVGTVPGLDAAQMHAHIDAALEPHRTTLSSAIQQAVRGPRSSLTKRGIDAMRASGADTLMLHILIEGRLAAPMVRAEMTRLTEGLRSGALTVDDVKRGLVTADGLLQRFALAGVDVDHPREGNGPRDLLVSFASSLHR